MRRRSGRRQRLIRTGIEQLERLGGVFLGRQTHRLAARLLIRRR
jgi:hypothetical protein